MKKAALIEFVELKAEIVGIRLVENSPIKGEFIVSFNDHVTTSIGWSEKEVLRDLLQPYWRVTTPLLRTDVVPFAALTDNQKTYAQEGGWSEEDSFVVYGGYPLSLGMFCRLQNSRWHGSYTISNTSSYVVRLSGDGCEALVTIL